MGFMPDVFLSYKREDLKTATRLVKALRTAGLEVWWDRDIPASAPWESTTGKALSEAKTVVVLWSTSAVASDNVRSEARWAREQGRLIQLFVDPCKPPLFFGEHQGIDLVGWSGSPADPRIRELTAAIRAKAEPEPVPDSMSRAAVPWRPPNAERMKAKVPDAELLRLQLVVDAASTRSSDAAAQARRALMNLPMAELATWQIG